MARPRQELDDDHGTATAGAWRRCCLIGYHRRCLVGRLGGGGRDNDGKRPADGGKLRFAMTVGEETVVANALEPVGQDVEVDRT